MGPLLMEGFWHLTCLGRRGNREEGKNGKRFKEISLCSFPLLVSHGSECLCRSLLLREVVGCTH